VFVTGADVSSFGDLVDEWLKQVGGRRLSYEPFGFDALRAGNRLAFGTASLPSYDFANAKYVLSFGADFLDTWLSPVEFQNGFTQAHAFDGARSASMAKFVYVGPRLSLTGMNADEWVAARPGTEGTLALAMAQVIVSRHLARQPADASRLVGLLSGYAPSAVADAIGIEQDVIVRLAREFASSGGGLAVAGGMAMQYANGAAIVAAVNILNYVAGSVGSLVTFGADLAIGSAGTFGDAEALRADMTAGRVALLLVHGANPAHSLPGAFQQALGKVPYKVSFSSYMDETTAACDLILPDHHPLEQWGDSRPRAGVTAFQQPVVQPVFETRPTGDVIPSSRDAAAPSGLRQAMARSATRQAANRQSRLINSFSMLRKGRHLRRNTDTRRPVGDRSLRRRPPSSRMTKVGQGVKSRRWSFLHPVLHDGRGANQAVVAGAARSRLKIAWR
jgi:molybdopterin-containing oxidoreductase family iron-sulfur binding subunit